MKYLLLPKNFLYLNKKIKMDILNWLNTFQNAWINKDIPVVLSLFSDQIEYWESPYQKVTTKQEIEELWKYIDMQDNIVLSLSLFSSDDDKNTVFWDLTYQKH